jgi:alkanesulfonate monooxygenase SsuD/methylene tetrahydromethanopterin reductase-like flavin-dependent oxidoreductase (luciferase family)
LGNILKFFLAGLGNLFKNMDSIVSSILEADRLGFDGAVMPDHYMWGTRNWGRSPDDHITLETWITLTYLSAKTEKIRLGTLVTPIPFRPPSILAKMVSTLDLLSKGRVVFGVGAGWSREEFEGYSEWNPPKIRVDKTEEGLELMIKLWTQKEVTFKGTYYQTKGAVLEPKPVQKPYPPLLFGGVGTRMLKLAGKYADICFIPPFRQTLDFFEKSKTIVLKAAEAANRQDKIEFMDGFMGSREPFSIERSVERIEAAITKGASYFLISFPHTDIHHNVMKEFAQDILPSYQ